MKPHACLLPLLAAALAAAGCRSVHVDYDASRDFASYRTFALYPPGGRVDSAFERDFPRVMEQVRLAVTDALVDGGLQRGADAQAGLLVRCRIELEADSHGAVAPPEPAAIPVGRLGPVVLAPRALTPVEDPDLSRDLKAGTLAIELFDRATGDPVWWGRVSRVIDLEELRREEWAREPDAEYERTVRKTVRDAVGVLLRDFPP